MIKNIFTTGFLLLTGFMVQAQTEIIAHRGYWNTENNAQNSLKALTKAAQEKFYGSEFDIHITKDDVLIVNHDDHINGIVIETSNYSDLANVKLKNGEDLPTLKTYLQKGKEFPKLKLILEVKPHKNKERENQAVFKILQLVKEMKLDKQVEYISFSDNICDQLKKNNPKATVSYLTGNLSPKDVKQRGWDGIDYHYNVYKENPTWIKEAKELGLITNAWTVNKPEIMDEMIAEKIQFISTDEPLILKTKLTERK